MEEKKEKRQTTIDEDEKQFADLLFGDLQEITPQVTNWIINHKIEYKRRKEKIREGRMLNIQGMPSKRNTSSC